MYTTQQSLLTSCKFSLCMVDMRTPQSLLTSCEFSLYTVDTCTLQQSLLTSCEFSLYTVDMCTLQVSAHLMRVLALYSGYMYPTNLCSPHVSSCSIQWIYMYPTNLCNCLCSPPASSHSTWWIRVLNSIYGGYVYSTAVSAQLPASSHSIQHIQRVCALYDSLCSPPASSRSVWWPVAAQARPSPLAPSARGARCPAAGPPSRSPALASCEPGPRSGCASCQSPAQHTTACQSSLGPAVPPPPPLQWNPASKSKTTLKSSRSGHKDHPKNQAKTVLKGTLKSRSGHKDHPKIGKDHPKVKQKWT